MEKFELHMGDCLHVLRAMPDNSVDACVTDPPYGLSDHKPADVLACLTAWLAGEEYRPKKKGFMGRSWDSWVPGPEVWREVFRVIKPGGHVVAFAGSRTHDLMSMALRLGGFECRDTVIWVYGSGFPKSMDVSKAIDKQDAAEARRARQLRFTEWMRSTGLTAARIDEITGTNGGHYTTASSQPSVATREHFEKIRPVLMGDVPEWVEHLVDERTVESENFKRREVLSQDTKARSTSGASAMPTMGGDTVYQTWDITAPATEDARQWQGWGTALKPAFEPALLFRKPLAGTIAENVLKHGTGALNIDGCRVPFDGAADKAESKGKNQHATFENGSRHNTILGDMGQNARGNYVASGRFPANLIHDGSDEVLALFPDSNGAGPSLPRTKVTGYGEGVVGTGGSDYLGGERIPYNAGSGSAARFFYCSKASRKDRNEGLPMGGDAATGNGATMRECENADWKSRNGNHHPTVKPTDLMRYLCRLVTHPGGLVLDPFAGSGSTGKAAMLEGFRFVGCELSEEYLEIARSRIEHAAQVYESTRQKPELPIQPDLFGSAA